MDFIDWDSYFVFDPKDPRLKNYVEVYDGSVLNTQLKFGCFLDSMLVPKMLFFFEISSEDQVRQNIASGYYCMFWDNALAVHSCVGRR